MTETAVNRRIFIILNRISVFFRLFIITHSILFNSFTLVSFFNVLFFNIFFFSFSLPGNTFHHSKLNLLYSLPFLCFSLLFFPGGLEDTVLESKHLYQKGFIGCIANLTIGELHEIALIAQAERGSNIRSCI